MLHSVTSGRFARLSGHVVGEQWEICHGNSLVDQGRNRRRWDRRASLCGRCARVRWTHRRNRPGPAGGQGRARHRCNGLLCHAGLHRNPQPLGRRRLVEPQSRTASRLWGDHLDQRQLRLQPRARAADRGRCRRCHRHLQLLRGHSRRADAPDRALGLEEVERIQGFDASQGQAAAALQRLLRPHSAAPVRDGPGRVEAGRDCR